MLPSVWITLPCHMSGFRPKRSHIVPVRFGRPFNSMGKQLCASIHAADTISSLLSVTDSEFMTSSLK